MFFTTLTVVGWIDVFIRSEYADILIQNLNYCIENKGLKVYAFCIMLSHLHLISSTEEGSLSDVLRDFKSYTAKKIIELIKQNPQESRKDWLLYLFEYYAKKQSHNVQYQFWQQHNQAISLETNDWITEKINYIHQNPVKARLTDEATHYIYSSAYPLTELKLEPWV